MESLDENPARPVAPIEQLRGAKPFIINLDLDAAFNSAREEGTAGPFLDALMSSAFAPAHSLRFIERVAIFSKSVDRFPAFQKWVVSIDGGKLRFGPREFVADVNTTRDREIHRALWDAKYGRISRPRDPQLLFVNATRLAKQIVLDPEILEFLLSKQKLVAMPRGEWQDRILIAYAVEHLLRDNNWPADAYRDLIDPATADVVRNATTPGRGILLLVAHMGFGAIRAACIQRLLGDPVALFGGRTSSPNSVSLKDQAGLFAGLRSLTDGKVVLITPDGALGASRQDISILGLPKTIGEGASFLAYEARCPTAWFNVKADLRGERFALDFQCGPQREASEKYPEFARRMALFYEQMLNSHFTGAPENLVVSNGAWLSFFRRGGRSSGGSPSVRRKKPHAAASPLSQPPT